MRLMEKPLISSEQIQQRVTELGRDISCRFEGKSILMLIVLKGSFLFGADLIRSITVPVEVDFIGARSYCGTLSQGVVEFTYRPQTSWSDRHIVVIEDIMDTGRTAQAIMDNLRLKEPASLTLCTLLDKPSRREVPIEPDLVGFTIGNEFVVGYGLDYEQQGRELADIRVLVPDA